MRQAILGVVVLATCPAWADPPAPAGALVLRAAVEPADAPTGTTLRLTATFENAGKAPLRVFVPEDAHAQAFPVWRLTSSDGTVFAPMPFIGQTMWEPGLQGEILTIEPGADRGFARDVPRFAAVKADGKTDWETPVVLPPGEYRVECSHAQDQARVPFGLEAFRVEMREEPGLWTGSVRSQPATIRVLPATKASLTLVLPDDVEAGGRFPVKVRFENPTHGPRTLNGFLRLSAHSKMYGGGFARVNLGPASAPEAVAVGPAGSREFEIDLSRLSWSTHRDGPGVWGLYEMIPEGHVFVGATFDAAGGGEILKADGGLRTIREPRVAPVTLLRLEVRPLGGTSVEVGLTNLGAEPLSVPRRLAYPTEVSFAVTDADGRRKAVHSITGEAPTSLEGLDDLERLPSTAVVVEGSSWDGDAFDPRRPATAEDFTTLAPKERVSRTFDVSRLVHGGLPPGRYAVVASWRNADDGTRFGRSSRAPVGLVRSEPVVVEVRPR